MSLVHPSQQVSDARRTQATLVVDRLAARLIANPFLRHHDPGVWQVADPNRNAVRIVTPNRLATQSPDRPDECVDIHRRIKVLGTLQQLGEVSDNMRRQLHPCLKVSSRAQYVNVQTRHPLKPLAQSMKPPIPKCHACVTALDPSDDVFDDHDEPYEDE